MLQLLIWLIVVFAVVGIVWWALGQIPLPPPLRVVANVILAVIAIMALIYMAQGLELPRMHPL